MNELGQAIKRRLEELGMYQADLAAKLGWSTTTISMIIRGRTHVSNERRVRLSEVLGVNLEGLPQSLPERPIEKFPGSEVGKKIRIALHKRGLTQTQLCDETGICTTTMSNIIHGKRKLRGRDHSKITSFLGITFPEADYSPDTPMGYLVQRIDALEVKVDLIADQVSSLITELDRRREDV